MKSTKIPMKLSNQSIGETVEIIEKWLAELEMQHMDILKLRLSLEEILLRWQDRFGSDTELELVKCSRMGQPYLMLRLPGEEYDPLDKKEEELDWSSRLMVDFGMAPEYTYSKGINQISVKLKKAKQNGFVSIVAAGGIALLLGVLGMFLFPELAASLEQAVIEPMREMILGLITATAGPLVFLSVLLGICGMDNLSDFGRLGRSTISRYLLGSALFLLVFGAAALPFFSLNYDKVGFSASQLAATVEMLMDIIPDNMAEPFVSGNTLQIVVLAMLVGLAVLALGDRAEGLKKIAAEANSVMGVLLGWAGKLIAFLVFLVLLESLWAGSLGDLASIIKPVIIVAFCSVLIPVSALIAAALKMHIPIVLLFKKILPVGLLAAATCSSSACLGKMMENCEKEMGMHKKAVNFAIPIGTIMIKPATAAHFLVVALFCAEHFGTACSPAWVIMAFLTAVLLSVAMPPVPGGALACFGALLTQLGLPAEAMVFAISMDLFLDRATTTSNVFFQQLMHLYNADKLGLRDKELLSRKDKKI